ncbi:nuclear transport factor 2 family protein [Futiania mangrovi]|uniref:Nuclear transport factor 2 family protein n=1 Tax=Futiania mangrovi TaxID=2959716 RepID=A0A9J6PH82_9PROT|nr:nuclear transport factor 2 family protein [Futiania mangrovii]MCP1337862.1 nuclear transport factor 2 family protein [Futiania mangrovii]
MLSADDMFAIHNLYAKYNLCSDAGDAEGYADCFTNDAVLTVQPQNVTLKGREALHGHKVRDVASRGGRYRRHVNGSLMIEPVDARTARGRCYLMAYNGMPGELPEMGDCGVYEDTVTKGADGVWRFSSRVLTMDGTTWSRS